MIYLDTSIIAPLYWTEALSDAVEQLILNKTEIGLSQLRDSNCIYNSWAVIGNYLRLTIF